MAEEIQAAPPQEPNSVLNSDQQANIDAGYQGVTNRNDPIQDALDDIDNKEEAAVAAPKAEEPVVDITPKDVTLPDGRVVTEEQFNNFVERVRAMEVLEQHPDILDQAIAAIKGHQGEVYKPSERGGEEENMSEQRLNQLESAITMMANQMALQNASSGSAPSSIQTEAQKIMAEVPGISVAQAVSFAKDRIAVRSPAGNGTPPVTTSERSGGVSNNSEESSYSDRMREAQQRIKAIKSPDEAADTAIAEAIKLEYMKKEQRGGM